MNTFGADRMRDEVILVARILMVVLFIASGWGKLTNFSGTVAYMAQLGVPSPSIATAVAILVEFFAALAVAVGLWTRPLALAIALFTLGTSFLGHPYWTMEGAARYANWVNFYKNLTIIGGLLLLYVTGPGRYSLDARLGRTGTA